MSPPVPHVVMLVSNDVRTDTRVRKVALAVAAMGARVTVVGTSADGWHHSRFGQAEILRVPVEFRLRDAAVARRDRRRRGQLPGLRGDAAAQSVTRLRLAVAERQAVGGDGGLHPDRLRLAGIRVRRNALRAGDAARRRAVWLAAGSWRRWYSALARVPWGASYQRSLPEVDDFELSLGPVIDGLQPDLVHAHDVQLIGVAALVAARARRQGRSVRWIYDAHEWVPGLSQYGGRTARVVASWADLESRFVARADRVVTVSEPLADALHGRYRLARRPAVVMNVPPVAAPRPGATSIRDVLGLEAGVPLLVYSGGVQAARGVATAVEALNHLPEAHLAVVAVPSPDSPAVAEVRRRAARRGVADRLHVLPPVPPDQVSAFLRSADVGLIPLRHFGSHEMALANKLFEYMHAGLPVVVSDCKAQADFVTEHGIGLVHPADDPAALAAAVRRVLEQAPAYRARLADPALQAGYTWQRQVEVLHEVYRELLPGGLAAAIPELPAAEPPEVTEPQRLAGAGPAPVGDGAAEPARVCLAIGPANSAGQAWAWSRAAIAHLPGVTAHVIAVRTGRYDYPADELVDPETYRSDVNWQLATWTEARSGWTHALFEAGRPILGGLVGRDFVADAGLLRAAGIRVGLALHGSEVRSPRRHRRAHEHSPFAGRPDALTRTLQQKADALLAQIAAFDGPVFVSTPDQLDDVPRATWLPVVVDLDAWPEQPGTLDRAVPLVVHAPSNPRLKGSADVERVLRPLADRGAIELRMITGVPPEEAAAVIRSADVVVDQLGLGLYGVLACEAMASGRLVLGNLGQPLRSRVGEEVPVVEVTPDTLGDVVRRILDDRDWGRAQASRGRAFVAGNHDGRRSAAVLAPFLGREGEDQPRSAWSTSSAALPSP